MQYSLHCQCLTVSAETEERKEPKPTNRKKKRGINGESVYNEIRDQSHLPGAPGMTSKQQLGEGHEAASLQISERASQTSGFQIIRGWISVLLRFFVTVTLGINCMGKQTHQCELTQTRENKTQGSSEASLKVR